MADRLVIVRETERLVVTAPGPQGAMATFINIDGGTPDAIPGFVGAVNGGTP